MCVWWVGEQFLHDGDVCNLGSLNLEKFVTDSGEVNYERLRHVVRIAVRMLDNVIDVSEFSVEKVANVFRNNRYAMSVSWLTTGCSVA